MTWPCQLTPGQAVSPGRGERPAAFACRYPAPSLASDKRSLECRAQSRLPIPAVPWVVTPEALEPYAPGVWDADADPAELYYLPEDLSQTHDLAAEPPGKIAELKELFWAEAERYKVLLPLLAAASTFFSMLPPLPEQSTFEFPLKAAIDDAQLKMAAAST